MYGYNQPHSGYGAPPGFGGFPAPGTGHPGGPPGMAPPGMQAPGMQQAQTQLPGRPSGLPANFAPPRGVDFNASVIHFGTAGSGRPDGGSRGDNMSGGGRRGLGMGSSMDQQRQQVRENMMALAPPSREEVARTIFVGNITDGIGGDEGLERILRAAGGLRRWTRASDADNKPCKFGFAEYEDAESLETAIEIFQHVEVPVKRPEAASKSEDGEPEQIEKTVLLVIVDEASKKYAEDWKGKRNESEEAVQFRIDTAKENLASVLASLHHAPANDADGDSAMQDGMVQQQSDPVTGEVITIPLSAEDELSDIPPEMRETVAAEIAAFRERSNRRDLERLKREEELETQAMGSRRSPPVSAPTGPAGGANGIPLGPRERGVAGAPSGPKGFHGAQIPKDYQAGVNFVNGGTNGAHAIGWIDRDDEDDSASDEELERRRRTKIESEQERTFKDAERRWEHRESAKISAMERERKREEHEAERAERDRQAMADRLAAWNDDEEAVRKHEEYYRDRGAWTRNRIAFRTREAQADDRDRMDEDRENQRSQRERERAQGLADSFLDRHAAEFDQRRTVTPVEPARFKMSLGAAAQKAQAATKSTRTAAEVEGLLEDEEDEDNHAKRTIVPIKIDFAAEGAMLGEEERKAAVQSLAAEIPTDTEKLWKWNVRWDHLDDSVIQEELVPFIERKMIEYLGVQEQLLVDLISTHIKDKGKPQDLVEELSVALDEEAEPMVKKLWRMIIFFSESERRGLST